LNTKKLIALGASIALVLGLVLSGLATTTTTTATQPTTTAAAAVINAAETEKSYNCMSPRGIQLAVEIKPLAARLDTIDGKTIYICQGEADPIIMPALYDIVKTKYPKTTWVYYQPSSSFGPTMPDATTTKEAKAVIRGISW
jgi:hypothetical protein